MPHAHLFPTLSAGGQQTVTWPREEIEDFTHMEYYRPATYVLETININETVIIPLAVSSIPDGFNGWHIIVVSRTCVNFGYLPVSTLMN